MSTSDLFSAIDISQLPPSVQARLASAGEYAQRQAEAFNAKLPRAVQDRLNKLLRAIMAQKMKRASALKELLALADTISAVAAPLAACKKGCSHCCHIPVSIHTADAQRIGRAIGRPPASPRLSLKEGIEYGYHMPCPFLKDNACSIYEHRPLPCRVQFNLDKDALLCELVQGVSVPVPYLDLTYLKGAYAMLAVGGMADIREFFPPAAG